MNNWARPFVLWSLGLLVSSSLPVSSLAAEPPPVASAPGATNVEAAAAAPTNTVSAAGTNQVDHYAETREMLVSLQREMTTQVAQHTAAITSSLAQIQPALDRLRQQQAESSATSNRTILIAAGLFAIAGFFGLGSLTVASVRAMGRFTDVAANAAARVPLAPPPVEASPDPSFKPAVSGTLEQASARFQGALEQLERRIKELEQTSHPSTNAAIAIEQPAGPAALTSGPAPGSAALSNGITASTPAAPGSSSTQTVLASTPSAATIEASSAAASHVAVQLGKGQALMNLEQVSDALECFDSALAEDPDNTDALLRKGMALEKLQDWEGALGCYDRAIRLDGTLTVAYLYKGGVCNRLERHREALDCYEHALRSERSRPIAS